jgi:two-component system, response regulator YesN
MNILLVDDDQTTLRRLQTEVAWASLDISNQYCATSAAMARAILARYQIHLLICDIEMPMENGLQFISEIRKSGADISCIILTAHARFSFAQEAVALGVESYILKPLDIPQVERTVAKAIAKRGKTRPGAGDNPCETAPSETATLAEKVKRYLIDNYAQDVTTADLASYFNYNADYLARAFKKHEHKSPTEYLTDYRLEMARAFLRYDTVSIGDIAMLVGFNSSSYFSTLFHHTYGVSPAKYRKDEHAPSNGVPMNVSQGDA